MKISQEYLGRVIAIIPARGGSKGIPKKNLRPVAGKPLLYYSIQAALAASTVTKVYVSTDDDEIALFAERFGANIIIRPAKLADDITTLDPVISSAVQAIEKDEEDIDLVVTIQPTSPLLTDKDIDGVVTSLIVNTADTAITVVDDRHLCWTIGSNGATPAYKKRVNRQQLPKNFRETGAVVACTRDQLKSGSRFGTKVTLYEVPYNRSFDIDTYADLYLCEAMLMRFRIVFTVVGYPEVGLGHAYRTIMLAHELVKYELIFVCEEKNKLAADYISQHGYHVTVCKENTLAETVCALSPDLVINDILDTEPEYITTLKQCGCKIVNFEDLGPGSMEADLVVNALYPYSLPSDHILVGPKYFCLRDEFLYINKEDTHNLSGRILLTFGGVDEGNLTTRVLDIIAPICIDKGYIVEIVLGPGFKHMRELGVLLSSMRKMRVKVIQDTKRISSHMLKADLAITSGGRTVLELAALSIPTMVICQNIRETTHTYASSEHGILNLGFRDHVTNHQIKETFLKVATDDTLRKIMKSKASSLDLSKGKERVIKKILSLLH